ncbi:MOSC domain-containing protein [Geomicrobium sp. JCM 19039]|uniref:MOSC domain-containing protein n=1 Tax=Geomicrobium sp. JCM 19039 TaxID=1460636 RepID=UPI00045F3263|nr:MOSC domain-containing protein [Geomicrobium sp. JCM 19039]GAK11930.1 hypothetical protein JCM19039_1654 [Geomicrobium sp. JCM 19039]
MLHPSIHTLSIGLPKEMNSQLVDKSIVTGIEKQPVKAVDLTYDGFEGDGVGNTKNHGGRDRAISFYPFEHYQMWEKEFDLSLTAPAFGENITVTNMLERDVHIGDIYNIGSATVQISQGRVPCNTIDRKLNVNGVFARFIETRYSGFFARVLHPGLIKEGDTLELMERTVDSPSVWACSDLYFKREDFVKIQLMLELKALSHEWKERYRKILMNSPKGG